MTTRLDTRFAVTLAALVALAAAACSSAPPDGTLGGSDTKAKTPTAKGGDGKGSTPAPADGKPGSPTTTTPLSDDKACGAKADEQTCAKCCIEKDPVSYDAADKVFFDCACAPAACATDCAASICATADNQNEPTAACKTCLDAKGKACADQAEAACQADAKCKAIDTCLQTECAPKAPKQP